VFLLGVVVLGMTFMFSGVSFLLDPSLGGRADRFSDLGRITILPAHPVAEFWEIVYLSALYMLGLLGLLAIIFLFFAPMLLAARFKELRRTPLQVAALSGLILYIPLAASDGALPYIPTMAFYWFLWMLLIYGGQLEQSRSSSLQTGRLVSKASQAISG
jgi:quinol-cytochrome oxidoreductase complex cytochrome b subunit